MLKTVPFEDKYISLFEALSPEKAEMLRFHGDVIPKSRTAVVRVPKKRPGEESSGETAFLGAGFLQAGQTYRARKDYPALSAYNVHMDFSVDFGDPEAVWAAEKLLKALIARCEKLQAKEPEKTLALTYWVRSDARETRAFFECFGFREAYRVYRMGRELGESPASERNPKITEIDLLDPEAMKRYIEGSREAYGVPDSEDEMRFRILRQGARVFTIEEKTFVTVWPLGQGAAATENVFTRAAFRRQGLSKRLLSGVAAILRDEGVQRLELNVYPKFAAHALRMYRGLGYKRLYTLLEIRKNIPETV